MKTEKKPKKPFMSGYKKYEISNGFGSPQEWSSAFYERMGFDKALEVLGEDDPIVILGVKKDSTWDEVQKSYRKLFLFWHPDRNKTENSEEMTKKINAAYEILEKRFDK